MPSRYERKPATPTRPMTPPPAPMAPPSKKSGTPKPPPKPRGPNDGSTRGGTRGQNQVGWDGEELPAGRPDVARKPEDRQGTRNPRNPKP